MDLKIIKMESEKEIRSLVWKYFWEQKVKELKPFLPYFLFIITFVGVAFCFNQFPKWYCWFGLIPISIVIICLIYSWIKSNWEKAIKRANIDYKENK